jgi:hypothetical protein
MGKSHTHNFQVKATLKHRNKIEVDDGKKLFDGCEYFLREEKIAEIFSANYVVDDETKGERDNVKHFPL